MNNFCYNCGSALPNNSNVCSNCGAPVNVNNLNVMPNNNMYYNQSMMSNVNYNQYNNNSKNGASIASMVLGIIAAIWTFLAFLSLETLSSLTFEGMMISEFIGYVIGYTLFSLIPSIIGLSLAISSQKKQANGFNKSGLILNIVSLCLNAVIIINLVSLYS